ncbi:hypothetical protein [Streptomyces sp. C10-9-1]|uniref:hypothetical protein n=1 Tax=Streptomyces sp. C10-9-1 TaxID=1859285 RepID=UPI003F4A18D3
MARIQVLELPVHPGEDGDIPFVLIIDQAADDTGLITEGSDIWSAFKSNTGCRHVIITTDTLDIPANDTSGYVTTPASDFVLSIDASDPLAHLVDQAKQQSVASR